MTKYNERLGEILEDFGMSCARQSVVTLEDVNEAKQAITSLTKELVAEAKPEMKPYENSHEWYNASRKLDQFEQNLLKALEEAK